MVRLEGLYPERVDELNQGIMDLPELVRLDEDHTGISAAGPYFPLPCSLLEPVEPDEDPTEF